MAARGVAAQHLCGSPCDDRCPLLPVRGQGGLFERALGPSFDQVALSLRIYYRREQTSLTLGKEALKSPTSPGGRQCTGTLAGS